VILTKKKKGKIFQNHC